MDVDSVLSRSSEILISGLLLLCIYFIDLFENPLVNYNSFCFASQELWKHPSLHLPFSLGITFSQAGIFIGLLPIGTFLLWKLVPESFGTNRNPLRVSVKLL